MIRGPGDRITRLTEDGFKKDGGYADAWSSLGAGLSEVSARMARFGGNAPAAASELNRALESSPEKYRDQIRDAFERGYPKCATPIEVAILPWLLAQHYLPYFDYHPACLFPGEGDQLVDTTVAVIPQLPIGTYRADFALAAKRGGPVRFVIVECDGAAWHDSVEQVKRDVNRDVRILNNPRVLDIVRITSKDIFKDPKAAAALAAKAVTEAWKSTNSYLDGKFGKKKNG